jgi:2-polyprenyl-3-methyl-5-hydroxy-6-metoxy-1,4-benzoquinol methylase
MIFNLEHRRREDEWMDAPDADPAELEKSLRFIRRVNSLLGYTRSTIGHLDRLMRVLPGIPLRHPIPSEAPAVHPGLQLKILDVATGSGDVPRAILRWADRRKFDCEVTGIDLHHATLHRAFELERDARLHFTRGDATQLPFADRSFDFVLTSMFLHHLDPPMVISVLREMDRVAKRGVIIADLLRSRRAYAWISLFTAFSNPMVKHDARVSVSGAFTSDELVGMASQAGLAYLKPHRHFGHRLVLAGLKPNVTTSDRS